MSGMLQPEVLVLGGTGTVGSGVVAALLEAESRVLVVGRDARRLRALEQRFGDAAGLETMLGSVADDASADALATAIAERDRPLAAVVASLGSPLASGRLIDRPASALLRRLQRDLLPHLAAARHLLPLLADLGGRYLLIGSPCALRPWAGHGDSSIAASATRMLTQVLREEAQPLGVRVQMLSVEQPVCHPERKMQACPEWFSPLAVGRNVVNLLAGRGQPDPVIVNADKKLALQSVQGLLAGVSLPLSVSP
ncbi:MAG TPA: SDR family NAD(P)-dependent oxidoreductase [Stenotrophomonas sp.]|jgi:NAD(P)-dependent dehydrogenase (short-subunit alcohol dehydrogenase family)